MVRPTLVDMNPVELKYYLLMISLNKCTGSCNVLSPKTCVSTETKDINVKVFNMITNKTEAKAMTGHISCDCKCKFNSATCNSKQKWNNTTCQCDCKNYRKCKKDYSWNPSTCICQNSSKYLKSIADTSVTECDNCYGYCINKKANTLARKKANTIATNVTSTASINFHSEKSEIAIFCIQFY